MSLQLVPDPEIHHFEWGGTHVLVAPRHKAPIIPAVEVVEDDIWGVLAAPPAYRRPTEPKLRTLTEAWEAEPKVPGAVTWREQSAALIATLYDLDGEPRSEPQWVERALSGILGLAEEREITTLGSYPLGCRFGGFETRRFLLLLRGILSQSSAQWPQSWLIRSDHSKLKVES